MKDNWIFYLIGIIILPSLLPWLVTKLNIESVSRLLNLLGYEIPIWSLILSIILTITIYKIYKKITNVGKLEIYKATYGLGINIFDITEKLNKNIIDNKLKIVLSNNIAGDPIPGRVKRGVIEYKLGNTKMTKEFIEGDVIDIP